MVKLEINKRVAEMQPETEMTATKRRNICLFFKEKTCLDGPDGRQGKQKILIESNPQLGGAGH